MDFYICSSLSISLCW